MNLKMIWLTISPSMSKSKFAKTKLFRYMSIHNVFAHDIEGEDLGSRMSIAIKKEQMVRKKGEEFNDIVKSRRSMVNFKDFVNSIQPNHTVQDADSDDTGRRESRDDSELDFKIEKLSGEEKANPNISPEEEKIAEAEIEVPDSKPLAYTTREERKDRDLFNNIPSFADDLAGQNAPKWFPERRRHSFSACQEEKFIMNIPHSEDFPRED